ncbi:MAG: AbrB/MazE/SpoVT family DNA-binding domain-containing protein [Moraxellaceae bacterium]|jgi:bifunctional DNA-binding transcriptional regulator/antitoxin component of YhaV-PrlF toxin-antitoxin module
MPEVKLREKGQVTIPAEILQEWGAKNHVQTNDAVDVVFANGIVMLIPKKRRNAKRDLLSFAGVGKGLWGDTPAAIEESLQEIRESWKK